MVIVLWFPIDKLATYILILNQELAKMLNEVDEKIEEHSINLIKKVLIGLGLIFILVGIIRQWPIVGKSYMEFIEGGGYLTLMLGLIMTVLGISVKLLIGQQKE